MPQIEVGDLIMFHDVRAYRHAMGFNYNGNLRSAEFLMKGNSTYQQILRAETIGDYFTTLTKFWLEGQ